LLLVYVYYCIGSLLLPIISHFVDNTQAVTFSYFSSGVKSDSHSILSDINPALALVSFLSVALLIYILHQNLSIKKG